MIKVEVVFAEQQQAEKIILQVFENTSVQEAIQQSGILNKFPALDLHKNKVGIFSKLVTLNTILQDGDRVEIYQPLLIDPKQIRKQRALKQKKKKN